jgi:hypothetical protein
MKGKESFNYLTKAGLSFSSENVQDYARHVAKPTNPFTTHRRVLHSRNRDLLELSGY